MPSLFVQLSRAALRLQGYINERITRILVEDETPPENHDPDSDSDNESDEETIVGDDEIYYITPEEYFDPPPVAIVGPVDPLGGVHVDVVEVSHHVLFCRFLSRDLLTFITRSHHCRSTTLHIMKTFLPMIWLQAVQKK